eukprot:c5474_g1_i1.p1 GENE.c5474_g1_i1~~c5474_g1_i1.p1  ORF type:complete len:162 (+),score=30.00 c5474_g1_i1:480-965(+)
MIWCHYPAGELIGAYWAGAGDARWAVWLSIIGYVTEIGVPFLSFRWWLLQTSTSHKPLFSIVAGVAFVSFVCRCVLMGYLLTFEIFPRLDKFLHFKQVFAFVFIVVGHFVVCVISAYWIHTVIVGGLRNFFVFTSRPRATEFSWTASFVNKDIYQSIKKSS